MRKVVAVALREYKAAVQTKAFLVSLLLMPVIVAISIAVQVFANRAEIGRTKTFAVIDRSGRLEPALTRAQLHHNEVEVLDEEPSRFFRPETEPIHETEERHVPGDPAGEHRLAEAGEVVDGLVHPQLHGPVDRRIVGRLPRADRDAAKA